jgi:hypothetical protein
MTESAKNWPYFTEIGKNMKKTLEFSLLQELLTSAQAFHIIAKEAF